MSGFEISGTATDEESAAIAAVVADVLTREAEVLSAPLPRPEQSDWVRAWRPTVKPLSVHPPGSATRASDADEEA